VVAIKAIMSKIVILSLHPDIGTIDGGEGDGGPGVDMLFL
jgi:hypothetical protein